jgi:hypothetical protein
MALHTRSLLCLCLQIARTAAMQVIQDVVAIAQDVEAKMHQLLQDERQEPSKR